MGYLEIMSFFKKYFPAEKVVWNVIGLFLFIYLILRAVFVPLLHDECATIFHYIYKLDFFPFIAVWDANNHVLNSGLSSLFYIIFGDFPVVFRIPNLLSFVIYFFSVFYISRYIQQKIIRNIFLIVMLFTHGFIEFFGYTRGYGMSMAFLMSVYVSAYALIEKPTEKVVALYSIWNILAVWANLTLLPLLFASDCFLLVFFVFKKRKSNVLQISILGFMTILKLFAVWFGFSLAKKGALYYGGEDFYYLSVQRLQELLWGHYNILTDSIIVFLFGISVGILIYVLAKKRNNYTYLYVSFLFFSALMAIFAQHILLNTNYPEDRTAMYLYPMFVLFFFFGLDLVRKKVLNLLVIPFLLIPIHFFVNINLKGSVLWWYEKVPYSFYTSIVKEYDEQRPFLCGSHKQHGFQWMYYDTKQLTALGPLQHDSYYDGLLDFVILKQENEKQIDYSNYDIIESDDWSGNTLLKRKKFLPLTKIVDTLLLQNKLVCGNEFTDIIRVNTDSLTGKNLVIDIKGSISHDYRTLNAVIIWSGSTDVNPNHFYYIYFLDFYKKHNNAFRANYILREIPENMKEIIVYVYNPKFLNFKINYINAAIYLMNNANEKMGY